MQVATCPGWNTLFGPATFPSIAVESVTLADVFERQRTERCDFLKIDREGAEYEILLQAPPAVLARVDRVALEYHDHLTPHRHDELIRLLREAGLKVEDRTYKPIPDRLHLRFTPFVTRPCAPCGRISGEGQHEHETLGQRRLSP